MKKRGLSGVVTVSLIILLAIAAVVIVWTFVKPFLTKTSSGIDASLFTTSLSIPEDKMKIDEATKHVRLAVKRGAGKADISALNIIIEDKNGNSKVFQQSNVPAELEAKVYNIYYNNTPINKIKKISISPAFKTSSGEAKSGQIIETQEIKNIENYKFPAEELALLAYWDFEDISGGILKDKSGNKHDGTILGNPEHIQNDKNPNLGKALKFDPTDAELDYIDVGNPPLLNQNFNKLSIAFWVKPIATTDPDAGLVGKGTSIYGATYHTDQNLYSYIDTGGGSAYLSTNIPINNWYHIIMIFDGTTSSEKLKIYVNGELKVSSNPSITSTGINANNFRIALKADGGISYFNGIIDEVQIYNRVLIPEEINALYEQGQ